MTKNNFYGMNNTKLTIGSYWLKPTEFDIRKVTDKKTKIETNK